MLAQLRRRRVERDHSVLADGLISAWRAAAEGAGACRITPTVTGPTVSTPPVVSVTFGPPIVLVIRLLAGQLVDDLRHAAARLAPSLGVPAVRVESYGLGYARVTLLPTDPLASPFRLSKVHVDSVLLGVTEAGPLRVAPAALPHVITQGSTRSGKSTWLYGLLLQLAHQERVRITGVDASGLTLRPWAGSDRVVCGLADLARVETALAALVADMDDRLDAMPAARDVLPVDELHPLVVVVLEEWPGVLRALDAADTKLGKRVRTLVARLLAESHKVGFRVIMAAQRAEASIVGAAERAQCAGRLSFRVDSPDSVKLLHTDAEDLAADHTTADPGIALVTWPGQPLARMRAPLVDYAAYVHGVSRLD